jgi:hypothetical protein
MTAAVWLMMRRGKDRFLSAKAAAADAPARSPPLIACPFPRRPSPAPHTAPSAASRPENLLQVLELLEDHCGGDGGVDFVDVNGGCPLDAGACGVPSLVV